MNVGGSLFRSSSLSWSLLCVFNAIMVLLYFVLGVLFVCPTVSAWKDLRFCRSSHFCWCWVVLLPMVDQQLVTVFRGQLFYYYSNPACMGNGSLSSCMHNGMQTDNSFPRKNRHQFRLKSSLEIHSKNDNKHKSYISVMSSQVKLFIKHFQK